MSDSRINREKELSDLEIPEFAYKADLELLTKYQSYSAELFRLSLLGLSVFGVMLSKQMLKDIKLIVVASIVCFGLAVACSLYHRFYSTEGLMYHILAIRKPNPVYKDRRNQMYRRSAIAMAIAAVMVGSAATLLCAGFVVAAF